MMIVIVIMIMIEVSFGISMQFSERFAGAWYVFVGFQWVQIISCISEQDRFLSMQGFQFQYSILRCNENRSLLWLIHVLRSFEIVWNITRFLSSNIIACEDVWEALGDVVFSATWVPKKHERPEKKLDNARMPVEDFEPSFGCCSRSKQPKVSVLDMIWLDCKEVGFHMFNGCHLDEYDILLYINVRLSFFWANSTPRGRITYDMSTRFVRFSHVHCIFI